jgi:phosphoribosyl 1,2-cyclic phosphodiesterase
VRKAEEPAKPVVKFWGVRGSTPTPSPENIGVGGNTSCVQLETAEPPVVIFDAGTGIRLLGEQLVKQAAGRPLEIHLLFTHFHWDHVLGLPFFPPLYDSRTSLTIYSSPYAAPLCSSVAGVMKYPYFPVEFNSLPARIRLVDVTSSGVRVGQAEVAAFPVSHPQGACGYRIRVSGSSFIYAPDREPGDEKLDQTVREYARGASLLIHDAQHTPEEYAIYRGRGHSSWSEAASVASDAGVKRLVLFHHDPQHTDEAIARITAEAQRMFPNTAAAREGTSIEI